MGKKRNGGSGFWLGLIIGMSLLLFRQHSAPTSWSLSNVGIGTFIYCLYSFSTKLQSGVKIKFEEFHQTRSL